MDCPGEDPEVAAEGEGYGHDGCQSWGMARRPVGQEDDGGS